jgi:hypothetical protein
MASSSDPSRPRCLIFSFRSCTMIKSQLRLGSDEITAHDDTSWQVCCKFSTAWLDVHTSTCAGPFTVLLASRFVVALLPLLGPGWRRSPACNMLLHVLSAISPDDKISKNSARVRSACKSCSWQQRQRCAPSHEAHPRRGAAMVGQCW